MQRPLLCRGNHAIVARMFFMLTENRNLLYSDIPCDILIY